MSVTHRSYHIPDPLTGQPVGMLALNAGRLSAVSVPGRCMDLYELKWDGIPISLTDRNAGIIDPSFECKGAESFSRSFFAGMLTTCGLIQAGRPCEEDGRSFGLHGWISHLPAAAWSASETDSELTLSAAIEERHPEGEHLRMERMIRIRDDEIHWRDQVTNPGPDTPFMMMYHVNFGTPFLSERLRIETAGFDYLEDRDSGLPASPEEALRMEGSRSGRPEKVYYSRPTEPRISLVNPDLKIRVEMTWQGFPWMGIWKNYLPTKYGLGLEPCACPGLGRVGARNRGLLPSLRRGESHISETRLLFSRI